MPDMKLTPDQFAIIYALCVPRKVHPNHRPFHADEASLYRLSAYTSRGGAPRFTYGQFVTILEELIDAGWIEYINSTTIRLTSAITHSIRNGAPHA